MKDYIFLMHGDAPSAPRADAWASYFARLGQAGAFQGGSSIGDGLCVSKSASAPEITRHLSGYIRVTAESLSAACCSGVR